MLLMQDLRVVTTGHPPGITINFDGSNNILNYFAGADGLVQIYGSLFCETKPDTWKGSW